MEPLVQGPERKADEGFQFEAMSSRDPIERDWSDQVLLEASQLGNGVELLRLDGLRLLYRDAQGEEMVVFLGGAPQPPKIARDVIGVDTDAGEVRDFNGARSLLCLNGSCTVHSTEHFPELPLPTFPDLGFSHIFMSQNTICGASGTEKHCSDERRDNLPKDWRIDDYLTGIPEVAQQVCPEDAEYIFPDTILPDQDASLLVGTTADGDGFIYQAADVLEWEAVPWSELAELSGPASCRTWPAERGSIVDGGVTGAFVAAHLGQTFVFVLTPNTLYGQIRQFGVR